MVLSFISDVALKKLLIIINVAFIVLGGLMIGHGIYLQSTTPDFADNLADAASDGTIPIISGAVDVFIGIVGLVGIFLKLRVVTMAYAGLVSAALLSNIILLIVMPISAFDDMDETKVQIENDMREFYGNLTSGDGILFTADLDKFMRDEKCCGFSGSETVNSFESSVWGKQNQSPKLYLPGACCVRSTGDSCQANPDLKQLRDSKIIYEKDCLSDMLSTAKINLWLKFSQTLLTSLMQIPLIGLAVVSILRGAAASS